MRTLPGRPSTLPHIYLLFCECLLSNATILEEVSFILMLLGKLFAWLCDLSVLLPSELHCDDTVLKNKCCSDMDSVWLSF